MSTDCNVERCIRVQLTTQKDDRTDYFLTVLEASERMGIPRSSFRRMLIDGKFPSVRLNEGAKARRRIVAADVEVWLAHDGDPPIEAYSCRPEPQPETPRDMSTVFGFIYWIGEPDTDAPVKVGFAKNVTTRLSQLQIGNWHEIVLLGCIPGTQVDEHAIRHWLTVRGYHVRGEWFDREAALQALRDEQEAFNYLDAKESFKRG